MRFLRKNLNTIRCKVYMQDIYKRYIVMICSNDI
nr:MAG TPA: hypothetical protein [Caudoviricetes sp.]